MELAALRAKTPVTVAGSLTWRDRAAWLEGVWGQRWGRREATLSQHGWTAGAGLPAQGWLPGAGCSCLGCCGLETPPCCLQRMLALQGAFRWLSLCSVMQWYGKGLPVGGAQQAGDAQACVDY